MITLTSLDGKTFVLNSDLIVTIHENANTIVVLNTGEHLIVNEKSKDIVRAVIAFKRAIFEGAAFVPQRDEE